MRNSRRLAAVALALTLISSPGCYCAFIVDRRNDVHFSEYTNERTHEYYAYCFIVDAIELAFSPLFYIGYGVDGEWKRGLWVFVPLVQVLPFPGWGDGSGNKRGQHQTGNDGQTPAQASQARDAERNAIQNRNNYESQQRMESFRQQQKNDQWNRDFNRKYR